MTLHSIGAVERDTGIKRDTLRVWERRYGFPQPVRNNKGERAYPEEQLRQLQRIRRLLDQGFRAGGLLPPDENMLNELESELLLTSPLEHGVEKILDAVTYADSTAVLMQLSRLYEKHGLDSFINKIVAPLLQVVGEQWASGKLQVFEEHFVSQQLTTFLNVKLADIQSATGHPKILLATLPGEEHTLGLLMLNSILSSHGIPTINLGAQVPMDQLAGAIDKFGINKVGISFSGAYQYNRIRDDLLEMRALISDDIEIWIGGEGVSRLRKLPSGVTKFTSLDDLPV